MEKSWPGCKGDPIIGKASPIEASLPYKYDLGYTIRVDNEVSVNPLEEARKLRVSDEPERSVHIRIRQTGEPGRGNLEMELNSR